LKPPYLNPLKKLAPYIILVLVIAAALLLFFTGNDRKEFDPRITFRKQDKIPYGTYIAYQGLGSIFQEAAIETTRYSPGVWDSIDQPGYRQAYIVVSHRFFANEEELNQLIRFVSRGNDVFVSSMAIPDPVRAMLHCRISYFDLPFSGTVQAAPQDSFSVTLVQPPFTAPARYGYPGENAPVFFSSIDTSITTVLGLNPAGRHNFIHLKAGKGNFYLHLSPFAFTNYFLLHRSNLRYYEQVMSLVSPDVKRIIWDEYYQHKQFLYDVPDTARKSWFSTFMQFRGLKWALLSAVFILVIYTLMEMRRRQRYIPVLQKPRNDSLEFVKTVGRLYFEKGDHANLARKMASYFLEHVRTRYKIPTGTLDADFARNLQFKSGVEEAEIRDLLEYIRLAEGEDVMTNEQLATFHLKLEAFYRKA